MKQYEDKSVLQVEDLNGKNKMRIRNMERFVHFIDSKINLREKLLLRLLSIIIIIIINLFTVGLLVANNS